MAIERKNFSKQARAKLIRAVQEGVTDRARLYMVLRHHNAAVLEAKVQNAEDIRVARELGLQGPEHTACGMTVPEADFDFYVDLCTAKRLDEYQGKHKKLPWDRWSSRFKGFFWIGSFWRQLASLLKRPAPKALAAPPPPTPSHGLRITKGK